MMDSLARSVHALDGDEEAKRNGGELIDRILNTRVEGTESREILLAGIASYAEYLHAKHPEMADTLSTHTEDAAKRKVHWSEYPKDVRLLAQAQKDGEFDAIRDGGVWIDDILNDKTLDPAERADQAKKREYLRDHLQEMADRHLQSSDEHRRELRNKDTYVMQRQSAEEAEQYSTNKAQRAAQIRMSNRAIAKSVFGDAEYDQIDRMRSAENAEDRTVKIHHAQGNKYMNEGSHVLEINVAGSGSYLRELDYHGQTGRNRDRDWEESIRLQFGEPVKVPGFEDAHNIRRKSEQRLIDGEMVRRERYTVPGPIKFGIGLLDAGKYRIDESRKMMQNIAESFLTPIFEEWDKKKAENPDFVPKPVHLRMSGYSRGAVAAGYGENDIMDWIAKHPKYSGYAQYVKPETVLFDPVPGPDGADLKGYGSNTMPQGNHTCFYALANEHDSYFTPQSLQGAGKYILGTTIHASGQDYIDRSQMAVEGDGMAHKQGYYDVESGEYYRGGGMADLADGVYFSDDHQNLFKLNSFSQLGKIYDNLHTEGGAKEQLGRAKVLQETLKTYFADHELGISYTSEFEKNYCDQKRQRVETQLLGEEAAGKKLSGDLTQVQAALKKLNAGDRNDKELRKELLDACRDYMKRTPVSDRPEDRRRMDQVSDLCSLIKREICFEDKGYQPRKNKAACDAASLDARIGAAGERSVQLEKLTGAVMMNAESAKGMLNKLDATKKNGSDSKEYTRMRDAVKKVSELGDSNSISEIRAAYQEMQDAAEHYVKVRTTGLFKTSSKDGLQRIDVAESIGDLAEKILGQEAMDPKGISERHDPIWDVRMKNQAGLSEMSEMRSKLPALEQELNEAAIRQVLAEDRQEQAKQEEAKKEEKKKEEKKKEEVKGEEKKEDAKENNEKKESNEAPKKDAVLQEDVAARLEVPADAPKKAEPKEAAGSGAQEWSISRGDTVEYHPGQKGQPSAATHEDKAKQKAPQEAINAPVDPEKRVAVNVEGWGKSSFFYESKPVKGERKKTDFTSLVQEGKKDAPKKPDYKNLRNEKKLEQEDAIIPSGPSVKK